MPGEKIAIEGEDQMRSLGAKLSKVLKAGDIVLLYGDLGAGKTTLVRGLLEGLGVMGPVRSPTFNLIQLFDTNPPVMHADLYRVKTFENLGIEEYLETHLCLIEWADRAEGLVPPELCWRVHLEFADFGRTARVLPRKGVRFT